MVAAPGFITISFLLTPTEQPFWLTCKYHVVVTVTCTQILSVVALLLVQVYEPPPLPISRALSPLHIVSLDGTIVIVATGFGLTTTCTVAVSEHPAALVPISVYVVVTVGVAKVLLQKVHESEAAGLHW